MVSASAVEVWERHVRSVPLRCRAPVVSVLGDGNTQDMLSNAMGASSSSSLSPGMGESTSDYAVSGTLAPIGVQYGSYVAIQPSTVEGDSFGAGGILSTIVAISVAAGGVCIVAPKVDDLGFPQRHCLLEQLAEGVRLARMCHPLMESPLSPTPSHTNNGGFSAALIAVVVPSSLVCNVGDVSTWLFKAESTYVSETAERDLDAVERNGFRMIIRAAVGVPDIIPDVGLADFMKRAVVSKPRGQNKPLGWDVTCARLRQIIHECAPIQQSLSDAQITQCRQYLKSIVHEEFYSVCRVKSQKGPLPNESLQSIHSGVVTKINARVNFLVSEGIISENDSLFTSLSAEAVSLMASGLEKYGAAQKSYQISHLVDDAAVSRGMPTTASDRLSTTTSERLRMVRARLAQAKQHTSQFVVWYRLMVDTHVPRQYRFWLSGHGVLIVLGLALFIITSLWTGRGER